MITYYKFLPEKINIPGKYGDNVNDNEQSMSKL